MILRSNEGGGLQDDFENTMGYRYFMITQTEVNSSDNDCLFIGGVEFYGILIETPSVDM
jgi:hypothetical protein